MTHSFSPRKASLGARASIVMGAAAFLMLAGCGGGAPAPTAAPIGTPGAPTSAPTSGPTAVTGTVDACTLLTVEEVAAALGGTIDAASPESDGVYSYCTYTGGGGQVKTFVTVTAASYFGTVTINAGHAVAGVGDQAFLSTESFQPGLYFLKGAQLAFISELGDENAIITLGTLMASRM